MPDIEPPPMLVEPLDDPQARCNQYVRTRKRDIARLDRNRLCVGKLRLVFLSHIMRSV